MDPFGRCKADNWNFQGSLYNLLGQLANAGQGQNAPHGRRQMPERADLPPQYRHIDEQPWETLRWPGQESKMMFHPRSEHPTEPNAGLVRYEPGSHHPRHRHDFAQVWYILEGEFKIGDKQYGAGTMVFHPDPHFEEPLSTETGGLMLFVQYPGPSTGGRPIYDGRFNMKARRPIEEETVDI